MVTAACSSSGGREVCPVPHRHTATRLQPRQQRHKKGRRLAKKRHVRPAGPQVTDSQVWEGGGRLTAVNSIL